MSDATRDGLVTRARQTVDILKVLTRSDLKMRYGRGRVQLLKWLLDPLAALGVYLVLIAIVLDEGGSAVGLSLTCAIVPFQLVMTSVVNALSAVGLRGSIIINMPFPRSLIPISSVTTESVALVGSLTLIPLMMVIYGIAPTTALLWLPVAFIATLAVAIAFAFPAALIGIWYPELVSFAISLVRAMFFVAPGVVALDQVSGVARDVLPFNPLTGLFELFRDALLYGHAPAAWELLVPLAVAAIVLAVAVPIYRRELPQFVKLLA